MNNLFNKIKTYTHDVIFKARKPINVNASTSVNLYSPLAKSMVENAQRPEPGVSVCVDFDKKESDNYKK